MRTIESLDMKTFAKASGFGSFVILLVFFYYMLFLDFILLSFVITSFLFCFLVEVRFLAYLNLCKPLKKANLIIIILRE
jgi:hypothetical protein